MSSFPIMHFGPVGAEHRKKLAELAERYRAQCVYVYASQRGDGLSDYKICQNQGDVAGLKSSPYAHNQQIVWDRGEHVAEVRDEGGRLVVAPLSQASRPAAGSASAPSERVENLNRLFMDCSTCGYQTHTFLEVHLLDAGESWAAWRCQLCKSISRGCSDSELRQLAAKYSRPVSTRRA